jgi:cellulase/cellobiase CelA1
MNFTPCSGSNFRAAVTLRNPDARAVDGWTIDIDLDRSVVQAFGAEASEVSPGRWRFRPVDWTRQIPPGGEVRFTFIGRPGGLSVDPPETKLEVTYASPAPPQAAAPTPAKPAAQPAPSPAPSPAPTPAPAPAPPQQAAPEQKPTPPTGTEVVHTLGFKVKDAWADGFVGEVAVVNGSERSLRPWRFEFAMDGRIEQTWGADIKADGDGRWVALPHDYNREIEPGGFATFGFKSTSPFRSRPASTRLLQGE